MLKTSLLQDNIECIYMNNVCKGLQIRRKERVKIESEKKNKEKSETNERERDRERQIKSKCSFDDHVWNRHMIMCEYAHMMFEHK